MTISSDGYGTTGDQDYLTLMSCYEDDGWLPIAEQELQAWLRERRGWDVGLSGEGEYRNEDGSKTLQIVRRETPNSQSLRAHLVEQDSRNGSAWSTELVAFDRRGEGDWIRLHVSNSEGRFVDIPWLARNLMGRLHLGDGAMDFVDHPQVLGSGRLDELLQMLTDPDRVGLLFIAGSDGIGNIPFDPFVEKVGKWARQAYGLAQVIVLDPLATELMAERLGGFATKPWTIRTYFPQVALESPVDARRHRFLSTASLVDQPDSAIAKLLGRTARRHNQQTLVPDEVRRELRALDRRETHLITQGNFTVADAPTDAADSAPSADTSAVAQTAPAPEVVAHREDGAALSMSQVARLLGLDHLTSAALEKVGRAAKSAADLARRASRAEATVKRLNMQVGDLQARKNRAEDRVAELTRLAEDWELEIAETREELLGATATTDWLRGQLVRHEDYAHAYSEAPAEAADRYPASVEELLRRLPSVAGGRIVFTGDQKTVKAMDDSDTLGNAARTAWDVVRALEQYLELKDGDECPGGVDYFLRNLQKRGVTVSPGKHAATESEATLAKFGGERHFPVPASVDASKAALMDAHFRLAANGMISPRMHYLDESDRDGRIYIGYIGPHLPVVSTN